VDSFGLFSAVLDIPRSAFDAWAGAIELSTRSAETSSERSASGSLTQKPPASPSTSTNSNDERDLDVSVCVDPMSSSVNTEDAPSQAREEEANPADLPKSIEDPSGMPMVGIGFALGRSPLYHLPPDLSVPLSAFDATDGEGEIDEVRSSGERKRPFRLVRALMSLPRVTMASLVGTIERGAAVLNPLHRDSRRSPPTNAKSQPDMTPSAARMNETPKSAGGVSTSLPVKTSSAEDFPEERLILAAQSEEEWQAVATSDKCQSDAIIKESPGEQSEATSGFSNDQHKPQASAEILSSSSEPAPPSLISKALEKASMRLSQWWTGSDDKDYDGNSTGTAGKASADSEIAKRRDDYSDDESTPVSKSVAVVGRTSTQRATSQGPKQVLPYRMVSAYDMFATTVRTATSSREGLAICVLATYGAALEMWQKFIALWLAIPYLPKQKAEWVRVFIPIFVEIYSRIFQYSPLVAEGFRVVLTVRFV